MTEHELDSVQVMPLRQRPRSHRAPAAVNAALDTGVPVQLCDVALERVIGGPVPVGGRPPVSRRRCPARGSRPRAPAGRRRRQRLADAVPAVPIGSCSMSAAVHLVRLASALQLVDLAQQRLPGPDRGRARQLVDVGLQRLAGAGCSSAIVLLLNVGRRAPGDAGQPAADRPGAGTALRIPGPRVRTS